MVELDVDGAGTGVSRAQAERMTEICRRYRLTSDPVIAFDPEQREQLWKARAALYPTLYRCDPRKKPINFVDDVVVPAERIGELIRYLEEFLRRTASVGCNF